MFDQEVSVVKTATDALAQAANDAIANRDAQLTTANALIQLDTSIIATRDQTIVDLTKQLVAVSPGKIYDHIECHPWNQNSKAQVGGSGLGAASNKQPAIECAELAILPDAPIPVASGGTGKNYFDCYYTQDFPLNVALTNFKLEASFLFPTLADANASQCLEMEARHVLPNGDMFIIACQMNFADKTLRVFDHVKKWYATGTTQVRFAPLTWNTVVLEGHHDATKIYYDGVTLNGVKSGVGLTGDVFNLGWVQMNRVALQLDGNGAGTPYRVKIDNVRLTVS